MCRAPNVVSHFSSFVLQTLILVCRCFLLGVFLLILVTPRHGTAQTATLRGFVTDRSTGQSLELVNVILEDDAGNVTGTVTTPDGLYQFRRIPAGAYQLRASFIGFRNLVDTLLLAPDEVRTYNMALDIDTGELDELVVEAASEASSAAPIAGLQTIRPAEIDRAPSPDVSGDLVSYLTTLPGVISTGDQGGQLYIRGGEPTQNMVMLDGILVYQPFHILGFYSAFPSDIINKADVFAGGFGAKYGGRLSSVIDIRSREGNAYSFSGSGALSPFVGSLLLEGPLIPGRVSFLASFRQSLLDEMAEQYVDDDLPFEFNDVFGKLDVDVTRTSKLSGTFLHTTDEGTLADVDDSGPSDLVRWENTIIGGRFLFLPRDFAGSVELRLSFSELRNEIGPDSNPLRTSSIRNTHVILEASFLNESLNANAGVDLRPTTITSELEGLYQNLDFRTARFVNWGNYLEMDIEIGDYFRLQPSLRAQFYKVRFAPFLEPRLRAVWEKGRHRISAGTGVYQQEVLGLTDRRDAANVFIAWTSIPSDSSPAESVAKGRIQRALHALLGYNLDLGEGFVFSTESYYKRLSNLFIAEWTSFPRFTTQLQPASGESAGFDVRLQYQRGTFYTQASYAYSATTYSAEQAALILWYGEESLDFRPPHDRRHQANVLVGGEVLGFEASARWTFGSGFPFSRAIGFDGFALIQDIEDIGRLPTSRRVIYERPFEGELPDYHRLDLSIERAFDVDLAEITLQASVINAYNRSNIFFLDVFTLQRVDQLPVIPSLGIKVSFE